MRPGRGPADRRRRPIPAREPQGCGYVRFEYSGDVGDHWGRVYDQRTDKVVYVWTNGKMSVGCTDAIMAGVEPQCASWTTLSCADFTADARP